MPSEPYPDARPIRGPLVAPIGNPSELVKWAVLSGRIAAADSATWLGYLTGPGGTDYANRLLSSDRTQWVIETT